jgi:RNA recognition motif-containing protein
MCKELPVIPVNKVVDLKRIIGKKWRAKEEERHKGSLSPKKLFVSQVRVLFVRNLMPSTSEDTIRKVFTDFGGAAGCVERVKKMKDYAFVHFGNREAAEKAIRAAKNLTLDGSKVEVSW